MNDRVKSALVIGAAIVIATLLWIYFSPYHTCVRAERAENAEWRCAIAMGGRR